MLEAVLGAALEQELVGDAAIASTLAQADAFWALREAMSDAQKPEGGSIKHDISLPVAAIPEFLAQAGPLVYEVVPGARVVCFGHMGDGNLHYNVSQPVGMDRDIYLARWADMNAAVHGLVAAMGGSFSAEHGIGQLKRGLLAATLDPVSLHLMRRIKAVFDPLGIMNPGKVLE